MAETVLNILLWIVLILNIAVLLTFFVMVVTRAVKDRIESKKEQIEMLKRRIADEADSRRVGETDLLNYVKEFDQKLKEFKCTFDADREMNFVINCSNVDRFLNIQDRLRELEKGYE